MCPDLAIYWTLGNFLKPLATINLPQSPQFLGNFCKRVKIIHFSSETILGQLLQTFGDFYLVTLNHRISNLIIFGNVAFVYFMHSDQSFSDSVKLVLFERLVRLIVKFPQIKIQSFKLVVTLKVVKSGKRSTHSNNTGSFLC